MTITENGIDVIFAKREFGNRCFAGGPAVILTGTGAVVGGQNAKLRTADPRDCNNSICRPQSPVRSCYIAFSLPLSLSLSHCVMTIVYIYQAKPSYETTFTGCQGLKMYTRVTQRPSCVLFRLD